MNIQFQKVINGLEHHAGIADWGCWKDATENIKDYPEDYCSYYNEDDGLSGCGTKLLTDAITLLKEYESALRTMVYQYCTEQKQFLKGKDCDMPNQEVFFNSYMSAGEEAFRVLGIENGEEVPEDWLRW